MMRRLRAIAAVFRAAAGLNAEQARLLNVVDVMKLAMDAIRPGDQLEKRQIVDGDDLVASPIMAN
jgi:hypothetical protein